VISKLSLEEGNDFGDIGDIGDIEDIGKG